MIGLIDPPTPFDTLDAWLAFRRSLDKLPADDEQVIAAKHEADAMIREKRGLTH